MTHLQTELEIHFEDTSTGEVRTDSIDNSAASYFVLLAKSMRRMFDVVTQQLAALVSEEEEEYLSEGLDQSKGTCLSELPRLKCCSRQHT